MDIKQQIEEVKRFYPCLVFSPEKNEFSGEIYITKSDSYHIKIDLGPYPNYFPALFEIDERIPRKPDRHIYINTGACCLTTLAKSQILLKTKIKTLRDFIKEIVIPYLQNNSFYELHGRYNTLEYPHHHQGVVDGYKDILKISDEFILAKVIFNRINGTRLKIHHLCYCGTGVKLKKCTNGLHDQSYREFKLIDKKLVEIDFTSHFLPLLKEKGYI